MSFAFCHVQFFKKIRKKLFPDQKSCNKFVPKDDVQNKTNLRKVKSYRKLRSASVNILGPVVKTVLWLETTLPGYIQIQ